MIIKVKKTHEKTDYKIGKALNLPESDAFVITANYRNQVIMAEYPNKSITCPYLILELDKTPFVRVYGYDRLSMLKSFYQRCVERERKTARS